jgi:hypothetical protein
VEAIHGYLDEPISSSAFSRHLREGEQQFLELAITSADLYAKKVLFPHAAEFLQHTFCWRFTGINAAFYIRLACLIPRICRKGKKPVGSCRSGCESHGTCVSATQRKSCLNCCRNLAALTFFFTIVFTRTNTCFGSSKSRILFYAWENSFLRTTPSGIRRLRTSRAKSAHRRPAFSTA